MDEMKEMGTGGNITNVQLEERKAEEASRKAEGQKTNKVSGRIAEQELGKPDKLVFNRPDRLMAAGALLFGILFVWLFYGKYPGISIPIFVIAFTRCYLPIRALCLQKRRNSDGSSVSRFS